MAKDAAKATKNNGISSLAACKTNEFCWGST